MDKKARLDRRREITKEKREHGRMSNLVLEYFNVKYPVLYQEAAKFYASLNQQYPTTKDLRKTPGFNHFKATTVTTDTMVLKIPLDEATYVEEINSKPKETDTNPKEADKNPEENPNVDMIFPDIETNDLLEEIPQYIVDGIIQDLRAEPELQAIMMEVEDLTDVDIDIEINDDVRLEDELQQ